MPMLRCASRIITVIALSLASSASLAGQPAAADAFVRTAGAQFTLGGKPFFITGVNNHYLPWGSEAEVTRVLDGAVAMGANVVRTFLQPVIGSPDDAAKPTIWSFHRDQADSSNLNVHGNYLLYWDSESQSMGINIGLNGIQKVDFFISEAKKRGLRLIIAFLDFWAYTGGAQQVRSWYGSTDRNQFFFADPRPRRDYKDWVGFILHRRNPLTGTAYRDDATIMAWELMNEPEAPLPLRNAWIEEMASYVKSLDANHLVATGEDRLNGAGFSMPAIDFVTWHGYPKYYDLTPEQFDRLITRNCALAAQHRKPVVLEEFGYARSNSKPNQAQAYKMWLDTMSGDPDCAGWLVWRLVGRQDSGAFPADTFDQFDVYDDGGPTWIVLREAAHKGRPRP